MLSALIKGIEDEICPFPIIFGNKVPCHVHNNDPVGTALNLRKELMKAICFSGARRARHQNVTRFFIFH